MTPAERGDLARLQSRLTALERRVVSVAGAGVSSKGGPVQVRTTQLGFPAELTAAWDATNGYAWKRLRLEGVATDEPGVQPAGVQAVTPDGDESLAAGTRGWMEPSPDAQGWYFTASAGGSATSCRATLAGLLETSRVTFTILAGSGRCANIDAATLTGWRPDPDVEEWVSVGTFPTAIGDTSLTFAFADDDGDPVVTLSGLDGEDAEGSGGAVVTRALTVVGCAAGCLEYAIRPLTWCDSSPVTDCDELPDGAPRRYRVTAAGGTGDYAVLNGEWTAVWNAGCEWLIADAGDGVTGSVGWYPVSGMTPRRQLVNLTYPGGITAALLSADADSTDGCGTKTGTLDVDLPGSGSGATGTAPTLTVTAVGPCADDRCGDNTARVRVCCKGHTKYTGCDALPDYSGGWCLYGTNWSSGETLGGTLLGNYGPAAGSGAVAVLYCGVGPGNGYDETRVVCGWRIIGTAESAGDAVSWAALNNVGMWGVNTFAVVVYYDPDADDGAGAWVLGQLNYASFGTECTLNVVATAANDPDPTDDPFEIVFKIPYGVGTHHTLTLAKGPCADTPADPVCDAPACPDGAAEEYTAALSGGTGDYAVLNGDWTWTHVTGDTWAGALGACTATLYASSGTITFDAPGFSPLLKLVPVTAFACCGDTEIHVSEGLGTGTPPTATDLAPAGDCACP